MFLQNTIEACTPAEVPNADGLIEIAEPTEEIKLKLQAWFEFK